MKTCVIALVAAFALLSVNACGSSELSQDELENEAESVQSLAAEADLLVGDAAAGRAPSPYISVHADELAEEARSSQEDLSQPASDQDVKERAQRLAQDVSRIADALEKLESSPSQQTAQQLKPEVARLHQDVDAAVKKL